jgi:hypothetical protein
LQASDLIADMLCLRQGRLGGRLAIGTFCQVFFRSPLCRGFQLAVMVGTNFSWAEMHFFASSPVVYPEVWLKACTNSFSARASNAPTEEGVIAKAPAISA